MKKYHNNPRQIKEKNFVQLKSSLEEFGDLSGIVHNLDTDEILSGNQRFEALNLNDYEEKITDRFDPPTPGGTCAIGQIMINGEPYKVIHKTGWSEEKCQRAVLAANSRKLQGETDFDILSNWDEKVILEYYEEWELGLKPGDCTEEFTLPNGDKAPFQQMTFTLADSQAELIKEKIEAAKKRAEFKLIDTFGNENSNGNALYALISGQL